MAWRGMLLLLPAVLATDGHSEECAMLQRAAMKELPAEVEQERREVEQAGAQAAQALDWEKASLKEWMANVRHAPGADLEREVAKVQKAVRKAAEAKERGASLKKGREPQGKAEQAVHKAAHDLEDWGAAALHDKVKEVEKMELSEYGKPDLDKEEEEDQEEEEEEEAETPPHELRESALKKWKEAHGAASAPKDKEELKVEKAVHKAAYDLENWGPTALHDKMKEVEKMEWQEAHGAAPAPKDKEELKVEKAVRKAAYDPENWGPTALHDKVKKVEKMELLEYGKPDLDKEEEEEEEDQEEKEEAETPPHELRGSALEKWKEAHGAASAPKDKEELKVEKAVHKAAYDPENWGPTALHDKVKEVEKMELLEYGKPDLDKEEEEEEKVLSAGHKASRSPEWAKTMEKWQEAETFEKPEARQLGGAAHGAASAPKDKEELKVEKAVHKANEVEDWGEEFKKWMQAKDLD